MEPLKEMFNEKFFGKLAQEFKKVNKKFDHHGFLKTITSDLAPLSLNERMRKASHVLNTYLPSDYSETIDMMEKVIAGMPGGYTNLLFPDYVGQYGHDHFDRSMQALKQFTVYGSSEFAIREFLKRDFAMTIAVMNKWARDKNPHVRRLSSEGSRPRLPWSFKLEQVIKDPALTAGILEQLKHDKELYVKKSVANHLNDISKDNAPYMISMVRKWDQSNADTAWIVKHASRSLIKKGNAESLSVFNFEKNVKVEVNNFRISPARIRLGDALEFSFTIQSKKTKPQKLVVDYSVHYQKKSGTASAKVFKLKELQLLPGQNVDISKKQVFKDFTTRKHHAGRHVIEIMVNGKVFAKKDFQLLI